MVCCLMATRSSGCMSLLVLLGLAVTTSAVITEVRIGALFPMFKPGASSSPFAKDLSGISRFHAFKLAVDQFNNKSDGVFDEYLPNTRFVYARRDSKRDVGKAFLAALDVTQAFNGQGVHIVVGPASSGPAMNAQLLLKELAVPQISYSATSPLLSETSTYPYFFRTPPSDAFQGTAIVSLIKSFGWSQIAIIHGTDGYGQGGGTAVEEAARLNGVTVMTIQKFAEEQHDVSQELLAVKAVGASVVVLFSHAQEGALVMKEAYLRGMAGANSGYVWILSDGITASIATASEVLGVADTNKFFFGSMGLSPAASTTTPEYIAFKTAFEQQAYTDGTPGSCNTAVDDTGVFIFQQDHDDDPSTPMECAGIDPTLPDSLNSYAPYAYDAVYAYIVALHDLIEVQGKEVLLGPDIKAALLRVSFKGATGQVVFDDGTAYGGNNMGDRIVGVFYDVFTFASMERQMERVGSWDVVSGFRLCPGCVQFVWPTFNNRQPTGGLVCPEGSVVQGPVCALCETGTFFSNSSGECIPCPPGSFQDQPGQLTCLPCSPGYHQPSQKQVSCQRCGFKHFSDTEGAVDCQECPSKSATVLVDYFDARQLTPEQYIPVNASMCMCQAGYFGANGAVCEVCPANAECCFCDLPHADVIANIAAGKPSCDPCLKGNYPSALPGYILSTATNEHGINRPASVVGPVAVQCWSEEACFGGPLNQCRPGYSDKRCGSCLEGYSKVGNFCHQCEPGHTALLVLLCVLLGGFFILMTWVVTHHARLSSVMLLADLFQVTSMFSLFQLSWPRILLDLFSFVSIANFNSEIFFVDCVAVWPFYSRLFLWVLSPFILVAMFLVLNVLFKLISLVKAAPDHASGLAYYLDPNFRHRFLFGAFLLSLSAVHTMLCIKSLEPLMCVLNSDGSYSIIAAPSLDCYSDEWYQYLPVAIFGTICWGLMIPVGFVLLMRNLRNSKEPGKMKAIVGCFFSSYVPSCWWWDSLDMIRNFLLVCVITLFKNDLMFQTLLALLLMLGYMLLGMIFQPFKVSVLNWVDTIVDLGCVLTLMSGLFFSSGRLNDVWAGGNDFLAIAVFTMLVGCVLFIMFGITREFGHTKGKYKRRRISATGILEDSGSVPVSRRPSYGGVLHKNQVTPFTELPVEDLE